MDKSKYILAAMMGLLFFTRLNAQFAVGIQAGADKNYLITNNASQAFTNYNSQMGIAVGIPVKYRINEWLGIQSGVEYIQKNFQINRTGFFQGIYQKNSNAYIQLPVMGNFSFGGDQLRGFVNLGVYAAYWASSRLKGTEANLLNTNDTAFYTVNPINALGENNGYNYNEKYQFNSTKDNRMEFGWIAGAGVSYQMNEQFQLFIEGRHTSSFTDQQKNYQVNQIPRYNDTYSISIGCFFILPNYDN